MDNLFFILSKLAWGLLSPTNLIVLLFTLATILLFSNRTKTAKWILFPTAIFSISLLLYPIGDLLIYPLESRFYKPFELPENIDGIIVLGGGEELKHSLSWHTQELGNGGDRYIATAILAKHYPKAPVIFSGGNGFLQFQSTDNEGNIAQTLLTKLGVNKQRLIIESQSRNTFENFQLMKPLLPKSDGVYLLVTSAFHMPRSVAIARKQGIRVVAYPVDYRSNSPKYRQWDFDSFEHLEVLEPAWREWIGLTIYYWTGKTSEWLPKPED